jgi:hypothetical protein
VRAIPVGEFSSEREAENGGILLPKGSVAMVAVMHDGKARCDGKFVYGPTAENTTRAHHIESGLYGGCDVSTSRSEEKAIFFATSGHMEEGYVYVIDEGRLEAANVRAHDLRLKWSLPETC